MLLALGAVLAFTLSRHRPAPTVRLSLRAVAADGGTITSVRWQLNGRRWREGRSTPNGLRVGESIELCGRAAGYRQRCQQRLLLAGLNSVRLELPRTGVLLLPEPPPGALPARWLIDGQPVTTRRLKLAQGEAHQLCLFSPMKPPFCHSIQLSQERLELPWPWTVTQASGREPLREGERILSPASPQRRRSVIISQPPSEIDCGGAGRGPSPLSFLSAAPVRCIARHSDHPPHRFRVQPGERLEIQLPAFAQLSARALPPAATLWLNGERVSNPLRRELPSGVYELEARLRDRRTQRRVELQAGERERVILEFERDERR